MSGSRSKTLLATLSLLVACAAAPAASPDDPVPEDVRAGITAALKERVASLLETKNEHGVVTTRANYSKSFQRVDDDTYKVGFHVNKANEAKQVTERYVLTVTRAGSGKWAISGEELKHTYDGLRRTVPGDEDFHRFSSFRYEKEGLTVTASSGSVYKDYLEGDVVRLQLAADDLAYEFVPPMDWDRVRYNVLLSENEKYIIFEADILNIYCDPVMCSELLATAFTGLVESSRDQAAPDLIKAYNEWRKDTDERRSKSAFSGFYLPAKPDRLTVTLALRTNDRDQSFTLDYDNDKAEEVSVWAKGVGPVLSYYAEETRTAHNTLYDLEKRDDGAGRDYDLRSIRGTVEMGIEDPELLDGDLTYELITKREMTELPFRISQLRRDRTVAKESRNPRMTINSIQTGDGEELTWVKTGSSSGLVVFAEPVPAGAALTLRVQFQNKESIYHLSHSHSYVDRGGWMPFVRFGDLVNDFDLTLKVPATHKPLGIGRKIAEEVVGDVNVSRWVPESAVAFPSVIYGQYRHAESKVEATKIDGTKIPVTVHVDKLSMSDLGIVQGTLRGYADEAANSLNLFREIFGVDYLYEKLDLVNDPIGIIGNFYGQAPGSLIYLGSGVFRATGTLGAYSGQSLAEFGKRVIPHEVAHQWWGSLITNRNFRNYWFVESLAEYSAALFSEFYYGKKAYYEHVEDWRRRVLNADLTFSVQDATQLAGGFGDYAAAVYAKGPYMFHIMRSTWGDEIFFDYMKKMAQELAGKEIVSRDIQYAAEKAIGGDMNWFFDQWLRGVGEPEYTFTYDTRETEDGMYLVEGKVDQRILVGKKKHEVKGYFVAVVPVTVECKGGQTYEKKVVLEGPQASFRFKVPEKPKSVTLNQHGEALAHDVIERSGT
jgi:hypothetical protein